MRFNFAILAGIEYVEFSTSFNGRNSGKHTCTEHSSKQFCVALIFTKRSNTSLERISASRLLPGVLLFAVVFTTITSRRREVPPVRTTTEKAYVVQKIGELQNHFLHHLHGVGRKEAPPAVVPSRREASRLEGPPPSLERVEDRDVVAAGAGGEVLLHSVGFRLLLQGEHEGVPVGHPRGDDEDGLEASKDGAHDHHLADARVHGEVRKVLPERRELLVAAQRPDGEEEIHGVVHGLLVGGLQGAAEERLDAAEAERLDLQAQLLEGGPQELGLLVVQQVPVVHRPREEVEALAGLHSARASPPLPRRGLAGPRR
mmetsp:Transcript_9152/g.22061  ORF Transcript_9152/g.22061 Transcript_9152/m.22061 type:complete len:315 (-) Transcript_9152:2177-3121(-)